MDSEAKYLAERELFDEEALLVLAEDSGSGAKELLGIAVGEMWELLERMRQDLEMHDFNGVFLDAADAHGVASSMASKTLAQLAERASTMALIRNIDGIRISHRDMVEGLKQFELQIHLKGWS